MCSEPLVMNLDIRALGFTNTKVKLMSFFYQPFDRYIDPSGGGGGGGGGW